MLRGWGFVTYLLLFSAAPAVYASDLEGINDSGLEGAGAQGLAAQPFSCTGNALTQTGTCDFRGQKAAEAAANLTFFSDTSYSDVEDGDTDGDGVLNLADNCVLDANPLQTDSNFNGVGDACDSSTPALNNPTVYGVDVHTVDVQLSTDMGRSWMPNDCAGPDCGHLLRGDVKGLDTDADGRADFLGGEQFSWGATSLILNLSNLSFVDTYLFIAPGEAIAKIEDANGAYAPGLTRMQVRVAIGAATTNPALTGVASSAYGLCDEKLRNCVDGKVDEPSDQVLFDDRLWGRCDPDQWLDWAGTGYTTVDQFSDAEIAEATYAFETCLFKVAATPLSSPDGGNAFDPTQDTTRSPNAVRDYWMDQQVWDKITAGDPLGTTQDYDQELLVTAGFKPGRDVNGVGAPIGVDPADLDYALYFNDWRVAQQDRDPDKNINLSGAAPDTYEYYFRIETALLSGRRDCTSGRSSDPACVNLTTNNTSNPLWGEEYNVRNVAGDAQLDADAIKAAFGWLATDYTLSNLNPNEINGEDPELDGNKTGIGHDTGMNFMYAQDVQGFLFTCIGCDSADLIASGAAHEVVQQATLLTFEDYITALAVVPTVKHAAP